MPRPQPHTYSPFMENYIGQAQGNTIQELIDNYHQQLLDFYCSLPEEKADYAYAPGKWTVKEVLSHVIETDTIFAYRALSISRGETQTLPGFDQDQYMENAEVNRQSLHFLKESFKAQREVVRLLVGSFSEKQLATIGHVSDYRLSVNSTCFVLFGHALHHISILQERYLS